MKNLLRFEFHKLWRQASFYICGGIILAINFISVLQLKESSSSYPVSITATDSILLYSVGSYFFLVSSIFVALFVCQDFNYQTIKNIYSRGFSKKEVYFSKFIVAISAVSIIFFVSFILVTLFSLLCFGTMIKIGKMFLLLFGQWVLSLTYSSFAFSISYMLKKNGGAIALAILGTSIVSLFFLFIDIMILTRNIEFSLSAYWISSFLSDFSDIMVSNQRLIICFVLSFVYMILFVFLGYLVNNKKREI